MLNGMAFDWKNYSWQAMSWKSLKSVHFMRIYIKFKTSTPKGMRLSFENPLESLKSVHLMKICNFPQRCTERYGLWLEKLVFSTKSISFDIKQEIPWNLFICYFLRSADFTEICSFYKNRQFSVKKLQTV